MSNLDGLRQLYAQTASFYETQVIPVFGPLAADFAAWALHAFAEYYYYGRQFDPFDSERESVPHETESLATLDVIDLGTGTGILARSLAPQVHTVLGVDVSPAMLNIAQRHAPQNVSFVQADLHALPLQRGSFGLIVSSFGLNASTPKLALRSIRSTLRWKHNILAFQEWSVEDECSKILDEVLDTHTPAEVPMLDEKIRDFYATLKPWYDQLQDTEDYYTLLKHSGFDLVWVKEAAFASVHLPSIRTFVDYKMAWPGRRARIEAMSAQERLAFEQALNSQLGRFANPDGTFDWAPQLFRVFATL